MNLALKNIITFEQDQKGKMVISINEKEDTSKLKADELSIYKLLKDVIRTKRTKNINEINNMISMKDIESYAKNHDRDFLSLVEGIESKEKTLQAENKNFDRSKLADEKKWKNKSTSYYSAAAICVFFVMFITPLFVIIPGIICGILCKKISKKVRTLELTQKGSNEQEQWKGLKKYMENFSLLNEREVPELVLWEKYLVYATAFGVADKVLDQLKVKYPQLNDEEYMRNNGYAYMYMMSRYNFDRTLNSSMQRAYNAGVRERAARQAAASSSYSSGGGGGGGFSGGGGRRRRPDGRNGRKIERRDINEKKSNSWKLENEYASK